MGLFLYLGKEDFTVTIFTLVVFSNLGTDRSNILGLADRLDNYPLPIEDKRNLVQNAELKWAPGETAASLAKYEPQDVAVMMASSGYYKCVMAATCGRQSVQNKAAMNDLLNNAPASFEGVVLKMTKKDTYHYMSTRNNNFSNRSQKGTIIVT